MHCGDSEVEYYTGCYGLMQMVDNTVRRVPMAIVHIESPYLTGEVSALCPPDAVYDVIVGNVPGARAADDPDPEWHMANMVTTRCSAKRVCDVAPLNVRPVEKLAQDQPRQDFVEMQGGRLHDRNMGKGVVYKAEIQKIIVHKHRKIGRYKHRKRPKT